MNDDKSVDLYTYAVSPYGMKVYWALVFKGIRFNLHYVSPKDQHQIGFTKQQVVPVLKIGDEWRLDSGPICCWIDEEFPDRPFAGSNDEEKSAIAEAHRWVAQNMVALLFRTCIDRDTFGSAYRTGTKLARIMTATTGDIPWFAQYIWSFRMRGTEFVVNDAGMLDRSKPVAESRGLVTARFDEKLRKTGFIAGTEAISYADVAAYAQISCAPTFGFEGIVRPDSSSLIYDWYKEVDRHMDLSGCPELVPGWKPYRAT
jgi:glutathione S-transferase